MDLMSPGKSIPLVGRDSFQGDGKRQKLLLGQLGRVLHLSDRAAARSAAWLMARRAANSAMRLPRCFAVSKSPDRGASSGEASAGDMASAPPNPAVQFKSAGPLSFVLAGMAPVPVQIWPCCCDYVPTKDIVE